MDHSESALSGHADAVLVDALSLLCYNRPSITIEFIIIAMIPDSWHTCSRGFKDKPAKVTGDEKLPNLARDEEEAYFLTFDDADPNLEVERCESRRSMSWCAKVCLALVITVACLRVGDIVRHGLPGGKYQVL